MSRICLGHLLQSLESGEDVVIAEVTPLVEPVQPNNYVGEDGRRRREAFGGVLLRDEPMLGLSPEVLQIIIFATEDACDTLKSPDFMTKVGLVMIVDDVGSPTNRLFVLLSRDVESLESIGKILDVLRSHCE